MMRRIEIVATVSSDGMLTIAVPTDIAPGKHNVVVEIDDHKRSAEQPDDEWIPFVHETAGAWHGEFERMPQGELEQRETF